MKYILVIIIIIIVYLLYVCSIDLFNNTKNIELVISRYNENLNWLSEDLFNQFPATIYNKGINDDFFKNNNIKNVFNIKNVGRCDHTYLYHIINNYDNLADITIFLPGSLDMNHKIDNGKMLVNNVISHQDTVFIGREQDLSELYDFTLSEWTASNSSNSSINNESKLELATIRPFGKWFESHFKSKMLNKTVVAYFGIFSVSKEDILQHPKSYYEELISELDKHSNPEVGHYFERSWYAVFYPYKNIKVI